jgi:hypothetical protein
LKSSGFGKNVGSESSEEVDEDDDFFEISKQQEDKKLTRSKQ